MLKYLKLPNLLILVGLFTCSSVSSQNDTTWTVGTIQIQNSVTSEDIENANISLQAKTMQMIVPLSTFNSTTNSFGQVYFEIPVYIDNTVGINDLVKNGMHIFPNPGSEMNVFFENREKGIVQFFDMTGRMVRA